MPSSVVVGFVFDFFAEALDAFAAALVFRTDLIPFRRADLFRVLGKIVFCFVQVLQRVLNRLLQMFHVIRAIIWFRHASHPFARIVKLCCPCGAEAPPNRMRPFEAIHYKTDTAP